jgi:hypothetical protein
MYVLDRPVFSGSVHRLEYEQHRPPVLCTKHVLKLGQEIDAHGPLEPSQIHATAKPPAKTIRADALR